MASNLLSAAAELGLGDGGALRGQIDAAEEERKKKLLQIGSSMPDLNGNAMIGGAAMSLFGGMGGKRG